MKKILWLLCICLLSNYKLHSQTNKNGDCDSISKQQFMVIVNGLAGKVTDHASLTDSDAAILVKLYNTFSTNLYARKEDSINTAHPLGRIVHEFDHYYYDIFKKRYELILAKGGTQYLKKLDLWIGITMTWRCEDFFWIYTK